MKKKNNQKETILAMCYDFDKTLSPDDMQAQGYIQSLGCGVKEFWEESNGLAQNNEMDQNLAYMYLMATKARGKVLFTRDTLRQAGGKVQLFPGVETWFDRVINKYTILLLIALYLYIAYLCPVAPRFMVSMGDMDVFGYFFGFLGSVILIWFCKQLPQIKTLTFVGRNSICFYFMSGALPITLSAIVKMFYPQASPLGLFLIFGLTLIGAYIASLVIVKYLPWMLDIRKLRK